MTGAGGLVEFLTARLNEDEQWARAASQAYSYAADRTVPEGGVHWTWVTGENWDPVTPDPVTMEYIEGPDESMNANLATMEEWPDDNGRMMRQTYAGGIEEMDPAAAGHIVRHDPARVLADVEAKRDILDEVENMLGGDPYQEGMHAEKLLRLLASVYRSHPDWREDWAE